MNTKLISRFIFSVLAPALALGLAAGQATAQNYPNKPISFIVPYGPGTGNDIIARILSQKVGESWSQSLVVDNRSGAAGAIGTELAARAAPDGHTILIASTSQLINPYISKVRYDILKDFTAVVVPGTLPYLLAVPTASPAASIKELVAQAKAMPGKFNYAGSFGSVSHFMGEMLKTAGGIDIALIPYKGTPDAIADVSASFYVLAPAATPKPVVAALNREMVKALGTQEVKDKLSAAGVELNSTTPEEAAALLRTEVAGWGKVVRESGVEMK